MKIEKRVEALVWSGVLKSYNLGILKSFEENNINIVQWHNPDEEGRCKICNLMIGVHFNVEHAKNLLPSHVYCKCFWVGKP